MKIRLMGFLEELEEIIPYFKSNKNTISVSEFYQNRNSKEYRCYIEIKYDLKGINQESTGSKLKEHKRMVTF